MANEASVFPEEPVAIGLAGEQTPEEKELSQNLLEWLKLCEGSETETQFRVNATEDYDFYAGKQDTSDVLEKLAIQNRPNTVYNEIKPKVDMLVGAAAQMRLAPTLVAVGNEDEAMVEVQNGVFKHYRYKLKIPRIEMNCFEHAVKGGRSLMYFYLTGENPFQPEVAVKCIKGKNFYLDPDSIEFDMSDARFVFLDKWLDEVEIKAHWPDFVASTLSQSAIDMPAFFNQDRKKYRIVECWYRKMVKFYWFINPLTQQPDSLEEADWKRFATAVVEGIPIGQNPDGSEKKLQLPTPPEHKVVSAKRIHYAIFSGSQVLESGRSPYSFNSFPGVLFGAYKDEEENRWFGVISMMKDPQRGLNTMRRQLMHLLQTAPKGILIHEAGIILNEEEYDSKSSEPNFRLVVMAGKADSTHIRFSDQPNISPVYGQLDTVYEQSMKNTSGIQDPFLGIQTTSREAGVALKMRQDANIGVLYTLFDNLRDSRIEAGKVLLAMIQQYVKEPEVVRIEGQMGMQVLQANTQMNPQLQGFNDLSFGKYDVRVDESPEYITSRATTLQMLTDFSQNNPGAIPVDIILEYANLPFSTKQRVRQYQAEQAAEQKRQFDMQMQAEMTQHRDKMQLEENKLKKTGGKEHGKARR